MTPRKLLIGFYGVVVILAAGMVIVKALVG